MRIRAEPPEQMLVSMDTGITMYFWRMVGMEQLKEIHIKFGLKSRLTPEELRESKRPLIT